MISERLRLEVQSFVYNFFSNGYKLEWNEFVKIVQNKEKTFEAFKYFASICLEENIDDKIILWLNNNEINSIVKANVKYASSIGQSFVSLAQMFIYNRFETPIINSNYYNNLIGCGTDAVPLFAMWTNIILLDELNNVINESIAIKRLNERASFYYDSAIPERPFEDWEIDQEVW